MNNPEMLPQDDLELSVIDRLRTAIIYLTDAPPAPHHDELWKLLSLCVMRLSRLDSCPEPTWAHQASAYLTLNTLSSELRRQDPFHKIPHPDPRV